MSDAGGTAKPTERKTKAQAFASAVGWVWGGLSILLGLITIAAGGVVMIVFGALLLPPIVSAIRQRVPFMRRFGAPTAAAAVVAVAFAVVLPKPAVQTERKVTAETAPTTAPNLTSAPARADRPEPPKQDQTGREINAMWAQLTRITRACDQAAEGASNSLDLARSDPVRAYSAVETAKRTCANVGLDVMRINPPPSLERDARRAFGQALNDCGLAYAGKSVMFDRMLKVIDGDRRPSRVAAVQEAARSSQGQTIQCVLKITALADEQGVELSLGDGQR